MSLKSLLQVKLEAKRRIVTDADDPNFFYIACNRTHLSRKQYRNHLRVVHKMELKPLKPTPNFNIAPNPDDPNNYCDSCNWTFKTRATYRVHLKAVHEMISPILQRTTPNPDITADIDDPINYCKSCLTKYHDRYKYRYHLSRVYKMKLAPLSKATFDPIMSTREMNTKSCTICKVKYSNLNSYRDHVRRCHKNGNTIPIKRHTNVVTDLNSSIQPDPNNPKFYCQSCEKKYKTSQTYGAHLRDIHNIKMEPKKKPSKFESILPLFKEEELDVNNKHCFICKRDYSSKQVYQNHTNKVHKNGKKEPVNGKWRVDPSVQLDPKDPNFYCRSCKFTYASRLSYRIRLKKFHPLSTRIKKEDQPAHL